MNNSERTVYPGSSDSVNITGDGAGMIVAHLEGIQPGTKSRVMDLVASGVTDAARLRMAELEDLFASLN